MINCRWYPRYNPITFPILYIVVSITSHNDFWRSNFGLNRLFRSAYSRYIYAGINGPKPVGLGPSGSVLVLGPTKFWSLGPDWTRTGKISKSRIGPGPKNVGPILTGRSLDLAVLGSLIICNLSQVRVIWNAFDPLKMVQWCYIFLMKS